MKQHISNIKFTIESYGSKIDSYDAHIKQMKSDLTNATKVMNENTAACKNQINTMDSAYAEEFERIRDQLCKLELKLDETNAKFFKIDTKSEEQGSDSKLL